MDINQAQYQYTEESLYTITPENSQQSSDQISEQELGSFLDIIQPYAIQENANSNLSERVTVQPSGESSQVTNEVFAKNISQNQEKLNETTDSSLTNLSDVSNDRFKDIPVQQLGFDFWVAAHTGDLSYLKELINSPHFKELSVESIGLALKNAAMTNQIACFEEIFNCSRFNEISIKDLHEAWSILTDRQRSDY